MIHEIKTKVHHSEPSKAIAKMAIFGKAKSKALKGEKAAKMSDNYTLHKK